MLAWLRAAHFQPFRSPDLDVCENREAESRELLPSTSFWVRIADLVVNYPVTILVTGLAIPGSVGRAGCARKSNYGQLVDLDPDRPSVVGADAVRSYFAVGELSPAVAVIEHPTLDFRSPHGRAAIEEISRRLAAIGSVAEIRSLTRPVGEPEGPAIGTSLIRRLADRAVRIAAESRYVATKPLQAADVNHITRLEIVFKYRSVLGIEPPTARRRPLDVTTGHCGGPAP